MTRTVGASAALILAGCVSVGIPTDPDAFSVEIKAVAHLRPAQAVALINGYDSEAKEELKVHPWVTWVFDVRRLTDTAITMLRRPLEKHAITLDAQAGKTITLRVHGMRGHVVTLPPYAHTVAHLRLDAQFGDGTRAVIDATNGAPMANHQRAFDGALLFALNKLLIDEQFVAYMNR